MKIQFLGAARTVTGSCFVLQTKNARFAIDCGMHQGNAEIDKRNEATAPYEPENLDFILVTHAHIDHTGLLPKMVKDGFTGTIYATEPTVDLLEIMLLDSAHIQEMEAEWTNKKRARKGQDPIEPLYGQADAHKTAQYFKAVEYGQDFSPVEGVTVRYCDAGHILGSAMIRVVVEEDGETYNLLFTGDLGRPNQLLVSDPTLIERADHVFLESTYGDRDHKDEETSLEELAEAIERSTAKGEKVIIPAFAVERTQEIIYSLFILKKRGKLPDIPVYVDSPMAIRATEVFKDHPEYLDEETRAYIENGEHPLELENLTFTRSVAESKAINAKGGPGIVISASGMANAGRIKHHLRHNLWRPGASIVFVGYQAYGTPGRKIVDGAKRIRLFGENVAVKAKVYTIGGFSAHAGQSQILEWLEAFKVENGLSVFLVHGEEKAQDTLAELIRDRFNYTVHVPEYMEEMVLQPGQAYDVHADIERAKPSIDWTYLVGNTEHVLEDLRQRLGELESKKWEEQTEFRDRLLELKSRFEELVSEV
jgi:metallo-beta-lactamase family protein